MPVSRNIYPKMVAVSRNCLLTSQMYQTLVEKLSEAEMEDFRRWLQLVEDETKIAVNNGVHKNRHPF